MMRTALRTTFRFCFLLLVVSTVGCYDEVVPHNYGRSDQSSFRSLNGTGTLRGMFESAGHRTLTWRFLSPRLEQADVIVWAPDDFEPPSEQVQMWLEEWLVSSSYDRPDRTLVYIGRDYDAEPLYWQSVQNSAPPGLKKEYARRLSESKLRVNGKRPAKLTSNVAPDWFELDVQPKPAKVQRLRDDWSIDIDSTKINLRRNTRMIPIEPDTVLLADENYEPLVSEHKYESYQDVSKYGRLMMVENGSFLLNAALVNHEHRKLAGKLVAHVGSEPLNVVFLESGPDGITIHDVDPNAGPPTGLALFRVWPIGVPLTQLAVLGLMFVLMCWPVFGNPRRTKKKSLTDFGSHIAALGQLLHDSRDRAYAVKLIGLYRQSLDRRGSSALPAASEQPKLSSQNPSELP